MKQENIPVIKPRQPYMAVRTDHFKKIGFKTFGISQFYEFFLGNDLENCLQAVPDGSVDLLFEISEREIHTYIGGTVLKAKQWPMEAGSRYFGVRFFPGQCILPEDLSIKELINADIEIDGNYLGNRLTDRIQEGHTLEDWARIFLTYYGEKALKKQEDKGWNRLEEYVRNRIYESGGSVDMSTLEKETGYSACYIRRSFERVHGVSPKTFEKFIRFQNTLHHVNYKKEKTYEEIALECGYYDQEHMIREFKLFSGFTPEDYRKFIAGTPVQMLE